MKTKITNELLSNYELVEDENYKITQTHLEVMVPRGILVDTIVDVLKHTMNIIPDFSVDKSYEDTNGHIWYCYKLLESKPKIEIICWIDESKKVFTISADMKYVAGGDFHALKSDFEPMSIFFLNEKNEVFFNFHGNIEFSAPPA